MSAGTATGNSIGYIMTLNLTPIKYTALWCLPQEFYLSPDFVEKCKNAHFPMGYNVIRFSPLFATLSVSYFSISQH